MHAFISKLRHFHGFSWLAVGDDALMMPIIDMMKVNNEYDVGDTDEYDDEENDEYDDKDNDEYDDKDNDEYDYKDTDEYDDEDESLESLSLKNQSSLNTEQVLTINMTR